MFGNALSFEITLKQHSELTLSEYLGNYTFSANHAIVVAATRPFVGAVTDAALRCRLAGVTLEFCTLLWLQQQTARSIKCHSGFASDLGAE
jgi:hypothetical protein